jgi:hypothetical protein
VSHKKWYFCEMSTFKIFTLKGKVKRKKMKKKLTDEQQTQNIFPTPKVVVSEGTIAPDGNYYSTYEEFARDAMSVTGTQNEDLAFALLNQLARAQGPVSEKTELTVNSALTLLGTFQCENAQEAMMASHIIALHSHATKLFIKASNQVHTELQKTYYEMAQKLLRSFTNMLEAFQKYRRNGTQKMEIKHVHLHNGAQAIIGTVHQKDTQ